MPPAQYLGAEFVLEEMGEHGARPGHRALHPPGPAARGLAGGLITTGAIFSLLLGASVGSPGPQRLLEGLGFSTGFFFVILVSAILFTEANVTMPSVMLACRSPARDLARFWALAWIGNLIGAIAIGGLISLAQDYPADVTGLLDHLIAAKLSWRSQGGVGAWFEIVVSGMLANWLVGMAAFFATMGRTIFGKYIPVFLAVTLFVAANFQHSPANMAYFSLAEWMGHGPRLGRGPVVEHHPGRDRQPDRRHLLRRAAALVRAQAAGEGRWRSQVGAVGVAVGEAVPAG